MGSTPAAVLLRPASGRVGTSAIPSRCGRCGRRSGSSRSDGPRRAVAVRAGGGAAEVEVVAVVDLQAASALAAGDDTPPIAGFQRGLDGPSSVAGGGGVGSDVDQVVQQPVDERFGEELLDPVDVDRSDADDLAGLVGGGVAPLE